MAAIITALFGVPGALILFYCLRSVILLDEKDLRWRDRQGWHQANWEEVRDFFEVLPVDTRKDSRHLVVETVAGEKLRFDSVWMHYATLQRRIVEYAKWADGALLPNERREWLPYGMRPGDLPHSFAYDARNLQRLRRGNYIGMAIIAVMFLGFAAAILLIPDPKHDSPALRVIGFLICLAAAIGFPILSGRSELSVLKAAEERCLHQEEYEATQEGLTFRREGESRFIPWQDIVGYRLRPTPILIRAVQGNEFTAERNLSERALFTELVRKYATEGVEANLSRNTEEDLGGISARWTGGVEGSGDRVFHYRTRSVRSGLMIAWFFALAAPLSVGLRAVLGLENHADASLPIFTTCLIASCLYLTWRYRAARLSIGPKGIVHHLPFRQVILPWEKVVESEVKAQSLYLATAEGTKIQMDTTFLAYGSEIEPLVKQYLTAQPRDLRR